MGIKNHKALLFVVGSLTAVHILSAVLVGAFYPKIISPAADQMEYRLIALNILDHQTFSVAPAASHNPDMLRTPGYPLFVAFTYLFDRSGALTILLQQLMLGIMGAVLYFLLRYVSVREKVALGIVTVYLLEPQQWFYSLQTMTETLSSFLFIILLWIGLHSSKERPLLRAIVFGLLLGTLLLVKPTLAILAPFLLLLLCVTSYPDLKRVALHVCVAACIALIVVTPWLVRNYSLTDSIVLSVSPLYGIADGFATSKEAVGINGGESLYNDSNEKIGTAVFGYTRDGYDATVALAGKIVQEHGLVSLCAEQIKCAPDVWLSLSSIYRMLGEIIYPTSSGFLAVVGFMGALFAGIFSFFGIGLLFIKRQWRLIALSFLAMLLSITLLNVCVAYARTLIPLYPLIAIGIGVSLMWVMARMQSRIH